MSAALLLARRPGNTIGRLLALVAVSAAAIFMLSSVVLTFPRATVTRHLEAITMAPSVLQFGGILALLHLFPTGRPIGRRHRRIVIALWTYTVGFALFGIVRPGPMTLTGRPNPLGVGPLWLTDVHQAGTAGILVFGFAGFAVVVQRWRTATPVERAQLKWFVAGAALIALTMLLNVIPGDASTALVERVLSLVVVLAFWSLPLAVVVAITRYHLFDIDRVIRRTVGCSVVVGVLGLAYAALVIGLRQLLPVAGSDLAVAGSTLAVAALIVPVRTRVQRAVDRRFNRAQFDLAAVMGDFGAVAQRHVHIDVIAHDLQRVIAGAIQPATMDLWLRPDPAIRGRTPPARAGRVAEPDRQAESAPSSAASSAQISMR